MKINPSESKSYITRNFNNYNFVTKQMCIRDRCCQPVHYLWNLPRILNLNILATTLFAQFFCHPSLIVFQLFTLFPNVLTSCLILETSLCWLKLLLLVQIQWSNTNYFSLNPSFVTSKDMKVFCVSSFSSILSPFLYYSYTLLEIY